MSNNTRKSSKRKGKRATALVCI